MMGVPPGNTFGAVAFTFTSFGAFWLSFWALVTFFTTYMFVASLYMFVASLRTTAAIAVVFFGLLAATFFLLGIGNAGEKRKRRRKNRRLVRTGDCCGGLVCIFAAVVNSTFGRTVPPTGPVLGR